MSRAEALERYNALPVPDTTEEHWRFTDLSGFDPDSFGPGRGQSPGVAVPSMLALDVAAEAVVTETGIEITRAPAEIRFEPLDESHERLGAAGRLAGRQVRGPQRRRVAARPARARARRARARAAAVRPRRERDRGRLALLAAARDRRGGLALLAGRGALVGLARPERLLQLRGRAVRRAGREARVRLAAEPLARDVALRLEPRAGRARRRARLGQRRLRLQARQGADPERPRRAGRDLARDRRLLRRRRAAPRLRHLPGAHRARHRVRLRLQGRAARPRRPRSGAG